MMQGPAIRPGPAPRLRADISVVELPELRVRGPGVVRRLLEVLDEKGVPNLVALTKEEGADLRTVLDRRNRFYRLILYRGLGYIMADDLVFLHRKFGVNPFWLLFGIGPKYSAGAQAVRLAAGGEYPDPRPYYLVIPKRRRRPAR